MHSRFPIVSTNWTSPLSSNSPSCSNIHNHNDRPITIKLHPQTIKMQAPFILFVVFSFLASPSVTPLPEPNPTADSNTQLPPTINSDLLSRDTFSPREANSISTSAICGDSPRAGEPPCHNASTTLRSGLRMTGVGFVVLGVFVA
jgi:hypothetical protein